MNGKRKVLIRYSESFKSQVVREVELGASPTMIQKKYGIRGGSTIQYWIKRMGKLDALSKVIRVETPNEKSRVKELEKQIRELKESLADTQVRYLIAESQLEIVCEQQGLDVEEVKKKVLAKRSKKQ